MWRPLSIDDLNVNAEGLFALEECIDYGIGRNVKTDKEQNKRKLRDKPSAKLNKKRKLSSQQTDITPSKYGSSITTNLQIQDSVDEVEKSEVWNNFGLPDVIIKGLVTQNFMKPTHIQELTLPAAILGNRDIIGAAETGSGKTLAFGLPIISGILKDKGNFHENDSEERKKRLYALILTPTRELAIQIKNHLVEAAKFTNINIAVVIGGMAAVKQKRILSKHPEIVVATPGRLWELVQEGNEHLSQIDNIKYLAIDETDRMLEKGHFEELNMLLERLNFDKVKSEKRQNFVFSATLTLIHDLPKYLMKKFKTKKMTATQKLQKIINTLEMLNPKIVDITQSVAVPETLTESRISCAFDEKDIYVYYFLQKHPGRTLIFCNSIGCVKRLTNLLSILGCRSLQLHASMQQKQRLKNLERFRNEEQTVLVATDVASRGLDIPKIEHVLHYQVPRTSENYIHRSGRTARASLDGLTLLLIEPSELQNYIKLCRTLNREEDLPIFPVQDDYLKAVKQRVNLARELDKLDLQIRKGNSEEGWLQKAAREMDIIVDDFSNKYDKTNFSRLKKLAGSKRKQLHLLLAKPIFPMGFSGKYPFHLEEDFAFSNQETGVQIMKNFKTVEKKNKKM